MKKLLVLLLALVLVSCASVGATNPLNPANLRIHPYWERTSNATLHAGFHMICNQFDVDSAPDCMVLLTEGTQEEMDIILKTLNEPPVLVPEVEAMWFFWDIDTWLKIDPPFKYVP